MGATGAKILGRKLWWYGYDWIVALELLNLILVRRFLNYVGECCDRHMFKRVLGAKQFLQLTVKGHPFDIHHTRDRNDLVSFRFSIQRRFVTGGNTLDQDNENKKVIIAPYNRVPSCD